MVSRGEVYMYLNLQRIQTKTGFSAFNKFIDLISSAWFYNQPVTASMTRK